MVTKAEKAKSEIAKIVFLSRRRWIEELFKSGVDHADGTLTISRFKVDKLKQELRMEYNELGDNKILEHETEADRIIESIDNE